MWPMRQQRLMSLHPTVKENMHLQENILFDLDLKCCPMPSTSCDLCTYRVWSYYVKRFRRRCIHKNIHYLTLTPRSKSQEIVSAQYPLHYVTYSATKFEVATSKGLGGDTFTRNVMDAWTDGQTDGRTTDRLWYEIKYDFF